MKKLLTLALAASTMLPFGGWEAAAQGSHPKFVDEFIGSQVEKTEDDSDAKDEDAAKPGSSYKGTSSVERSQYDAYMDLIKQACSDGVMILRQAYLVVDAGGSEVVLDDTSNNEFGCTYSLGVRVIGGYVFGPQAMSPWNFDPVFESNKNPGDRPKIVAPTQYADLAEEPEYGNIEFNGNKVGHIYPGLLYSMRNPLSIDGDGFFPMRETGKTEGYIVWFCKPEGKELDKSTDLQVSVIPYIYDIDEDLAKLYDLSDKYVKNPLGAIFVVPEVSAAGQITFFLYGVGVQQDGDWKMLFPFADSSKVFDTVQILPKTEDEAAEEKAPSLRRRRKILAKPEPEAAPAAPVAPTAPAAPVAPVAPGTSVDVKAEGKDAAKPEAGKDKAEKPAKPVKPEKGAKPEKPVKPEKPAKPAKPVKPEKPVKPAKPEVETPEVDHPDLIFNEPAAEEPAVKEEPAMKDEPKGKKKSMGKPEPKAEPKSEPESDPIYDSVS